MNPNNLNGSSEIIKFFDERGIYSFGRDYILFHHKRFFHLLKLLEKTFARLAKVPEPEILIVGPSYEVELIDHYFPNARLTTIGYQHGRQLENRPKHLEFDLNEALYQEQWPEKSEYDVIIASEVIEHLYIHPEFFYKMMRAESGENGTLIVQTPNACSLIKRLQILKGKNPFQIPTGHTPSSDHFREYTLEETLSFGDNSGWRPTEWFVDNYFSSPQPKHRASYFISQFLPSTFRAGITVLYQAS